MGEDVHRCRFYAFIQFYRLVGFLQRGGRCFLCSLLFNVLLGAICICPMYFAALSFGLFFFNKYFCIICL